MCYLDNVKASKVSYPNMSPHIEASVPCPHIEHVQAFCVPYELYRTMYLIR